MHRRRQLCDAAFPVFVSEKTGEAHLGRADRKLGIRSRGRLAAALGGGAGAPPH